MKIVFCGDSITDSGRDRNDPASLGNGYVAILFEKLRNLYEDVNFTFVNAGITGDRIADVEKRVQTDIVDLKPDIVVLLVGINDTWRREDPLAPFDGEAFAASYENVVAAIKAGGAKLIIVEPFLFNVPDKRRFRRAFNEEVAIIRSVASRYADAFVPLDEMFAGVSQSVGISAYSADGIHPTHRASRLIADNVIKKIRPLL